MRHKEYLAAAARAAAEQLACDPTLYVQPDKERQGFLRP